MVYLLFSTTEQFFSKTIRFMSWSDYSHVEAVLPNGMLLGANALTGVSRTALVPKLENASSLFLCKVNLSYEEQKLFFEYLLKQEGKSYDWSALFGFIFRRNWENNRKWFCSELIAEAFIEAGHSVIDINVNKSHRIRPDMLLYSKEITGVTKDYAEIEEMIASYAVMNS